MLKVWARILQRVPGSRLVVKNKPFACEGAKAHVMRLLAAEGVDAWRVDLLPLQPRNSDHLEKYALLDVSLDTFPYAGTTTTCESIYMGVPCITMTGRCHAHNVSASLLAAVGLDARDWVAADADGYVELAARHAAPEGLAALAALRQGLRVQMLASPLCDAPSFVSRLEGVYRELWCRYVDRATSGSAEGNYAANGGAPKAPAAVGAAAAHDGSCSAAAADALQGTHVHCSGASGGQTKTHRQQHGAGAAATSSTGRLCTSSPAALSAAPPSPPEEVVQVKLARIAVRDDCDANSDDSSSGCVAAVAATRRSRQPLTKKSRWSDAAALGGLESSVDASALGETAASAAPPPPLLSASPDASHLGGLPAAAAVEVGQDESVAGAGPVAGDGGRAAQPAGVTEARSDSDAAMTGNVDNGG